MPGSVFDVSLGFVHPLATNRRTKVAGNRRMFIGILRPRILTHMAVRYRLPFEATMRPDDIHDVVRILKREIRRWPVPALAKYVDTPFTVLIPCILSLRTQDKTTLAASVRLFAIAATPTSMLAVPVKTIESAIYPVSFYRTKARAIHAICEQLLSQYGGSVPSDLDA